MKKTSHDVWIFPLPSGLQINLRDVPQEDLDFLDGIEQKTTRIAELEAVLRECRRVFDYYDCSIEQWSVTEERKLRREAIAKIDGVLNEDR